MKNFFANNTYFILLLCGSSILFGCGRADHARIVNKTEDTLILNLKLNYDYIPGYLGGNSPGPSPEYIISYDTINQIETLKLNPKESMYLGSIDAGLSREDHKTWEFTEITIKSPKGIAVVKNEEILKYVKKTSGTFLSFTTHYDFVIE